MKQMYPNQILGDGILSDLSDYSVPWAEDITSGDISKVFLDIGYYSHSAQKIIAPVIFDIAGLDFDDTTVTPLTTEQRTKIAGFIYTLFNRKWQRIWDLSNVEYNPIHNYNMNEFETIETDVDNRRTETGTVTNVIDDVTRETGTVTNVTDKDTTQTGTVSDNGSNSVDNGIYGFNSSTSVGSNTSDGTITNTRTDNLAGTDDTTETRTDNLTKDKDLTDTETRNLSNTDIGNRDTERELSKSGNIGVTTTQKMVTDELAAWQWTFFQTVFEDIDSICCLDIY